jgi:hypothetical protein
MRRFVFATAIVACLLTLGAGIASAVDYPARAGALLVRGRTDSGATIAGCGFAAGAGVQIQVDSAGDGATNATDVGCISQQVALSSAAHVVTATGLDPNGEMLTLSANVSATDPSSTSTSGSSLPFTGANSLLAGGIAIAMLAVGGLFTFVTRRRATDRPSIQG